MKAKREYTMDARRESTDRTRESILQASVDLSREKLSMEIVLADVAERAGATVQTVLRHFGSKEALFTAAREFGRNTVIAQRQAPVGELREDLRILVDHYELWGDAVIHFLGQEKHDEQLREIMAGGRAFHREWVTASIAPLLDRSTDALIDQLVVVTDVYTWKLLRRDMQLGRKATEQRMHALASAVIAHQHERK